jgi:hypothetical protein
LQPTFFATLGLFRRTQRETRTRKHPSLTPVFVWLFGWCFGCQRHKLAFVICWHFYLSSMLLDHCVMAFHGACDKIRKGVYANVGGLYFYFLYVYWEGKVLLYMYPTSLNREEGYFFIFFPKISHVIHSLTTVIHVCVGAGGLGTHLLAVDPV